MVFGDALEKMKSGAKMTRHGWIFRDAVYVEYTGTSIRPYLVVQYTATDVDIFANDWEQF